MKSQTRLTTVCALGLGLFALAAGGCQSHNRPITMTSQPTSLVSTDRLGGVMFDDRVALAQASRVAHARHIMITAANTAREREIAAAEAAAKTNAASMATVSEPR